MKDTSKSFKKRINDWKKKISLKVKIVVILKNDNDENFLFVGINQKIQCHMGIRTFNQLWYVLNILANYLFSPPTPPPPTEPVSFLFRSDLILFGLDKKLKIINTDEDLLI